MQEHYELGREAALLIWSDEEAAGQIEDPRIPAFAEGVMAGLASSLKAAPALMRRVVNHAAAAAEDLNVEAFQGLVEVLQNADDLGATSVRFALDIQGEKARLLIVHDGSPVTCHHVLAMTLPYLTTKTGDADQKGRFGIGLKTLKRISDRISIHSAPYHFSADGLDLIAAEPAKGLPGFYEPERDTLLELNLVQGVTADALVQWFEAWDEDGLLFLKSVRRFVWHDLANDTVLAKSVEPGEWETIRGANSDHAALDRRVVLGSGGAWTIYRSLVLTPPDLRRSHKATGAMTAISVALADHEHASGVFIGFRTRIPVNLPFSIDAQFDPSTAREGLIDNKWNKWLLARCGEVIAAIGLATLVSEPRAAWAAIPTSDEGVGVEGERWPRTAFAEALGAARRRVAEAGEIRIGDQAVPLQALAYEDADLEHLLSSEDLRVLCPELTPLTGGERDIHGRWRAVLDDVCVATCVDTADLVRGFSSDLFRERPTQWWIEAAACLTRVHPDDDIFGVSCWLTDQGEPIACQRRGETARPLLIGEPLSDFARRWHLFERLNDAYGAHASGEEAIDWLNRHAAVAATVDAADELAAFAERFADDPILVSDADLAAIRDRFDLLTDRRAEPLGPRVGQAILLDGFVHRNGKRADVKVAPTAAYLSRTLDSDFPYWPDAAGTLPGITWLASSYDTRLKTGATRSQRKRADGTISRGPRKFLMLLGAWCSPRVIKTGKKVWGGAYRTQELRALKTEFVQEDYASPDLDRVISSLERASKKDRRATSAALLKALSRHWEAYAGFLTVGAYHEATKYIWHRGQVAAEWLAHLHEASWVAVGTGALTTPSRAVIRSSQTQTIYAAEDFACGVMPEDVRPAFATTLKLITDVRASDLVAFLEQSRASPDGLDPIRLQQAYRSLSKLCPNVVGWNSKVGDLQINELRHRFSGGDGLIWVPSADGATGSWRRPDQLFVGRDIFLNPERFVPGGPSCQDLWGALQVRRPTLDACIATLRDLATRPYLSATEAVLIEIYRYIEPLVSRAERKHRERLRNLPVGVSGGTWSRGRPVYQLTDRELRSQLATARPDLEFWMPPCDIHALPNLCNALGLTAYLPTLEVPADATARELGEVLAPHFRRCVDHLSNELARNDHVTRDRLRVPWTKLRETSLCVYQQPFMVVVRSTELPAQQVAMRAVLQTEPLTLHVEEHAFAQRESCGRAIASLFPPDVQRRIEAEWVASWVASADETVELVATASDEEHARALADRAAATAVSPGKKIKVSPPGSRSAPMATPRRLKAAHGGVASVTIVGGSPPKAAAPSKPPLANTPPPAPPPPSANPSAPPEYTTADLEQRGWEILAEVLNGSQEADLVDFRRRHRVGADGVIDWKTFVELKATGRVPQSSIEMSATEFERARERGLNFILALVSGLEEGFRTEVRLILDPANRATVRPVGSVRLVALTDAPSILLQLEDLGHEASPVNADPVGTR